MKFLRSQVELNARRLKVGTDKLEKDDILAGLTAVLTVRLPEPQFEGQTKEVPRHPGRAQHRRDRDREHHGRSRFLVAQAGRQGAVGARARQDRGGDEVAHLGPGAQGRPSAARTRSSPPPSRRSSSTAVRPMCSTPNCSSWRGIRPSAPRSSRGTASTRPCCPFGQDPQRAEGVRGRHALQRRVRLDHPGRRRRLRAHLRHLPRPATARSS